MSRFGVQWLPFVLTLLAVPAVLSAQELPPNGLAPSAVEGGAWAGTVARALSPASGRSTLVPPTRLTLGRADVRPETDGETPVPVLQVRARNRKGVPLMIGGGVLFVAGAMIGGDAGTLLMVGGAGAGAYGAYIYFGG
jgi:hypothetical protein